MISKRPPILLATDNNSQKNKLLEKLLKLNAAAVCVSVSEVIVNPDQYLVQQPTILIIDLGKERPITKSMDALTLTRLENLKVILLADPKALYALDQGEGASWEMPFTIISSEPSIRELALALNYCSAIIATQLAMQEQKRERWVQKALAGLYQQTEEPDAMLAGIMGITATALNLQCAVIKLKDEANIESIISHSGSKTDRLALLWKRLPHDQLSTNLMHRFIQLTEIGTSAHPLTKRSKNIFAPTTGLVTSISRNVTQPFVFCALGDPDRIYLDYEKRIFEQSAVLASMAVRITARKKVPPTEGWPRESTVHQREL
jgi:hypothetical protein